MSLSHTTFCTDELLSTPLPHSPNSLSQQAHLASKEKEPVHSACTWSNKGQVVCMWLRDRKVKSCTTWIIFYFCPLSSSLIKGKSPAPSALFSDFRSHAKHQSFYILSTWCKGMCVLSRISRFVFNSAAYVYTRIFMCLCVYL